MSSATKSRTSPAIVLETTWTRETPIGPMSKGGGLISNFGSANQMMGVRQTTDFLEKATWTMAIILVVLCLMSSMSIKSGRSDGAQDTQMREQIELNTPAAPAAEAPAE